MYRKFGVALLCAAAFVPVASAAATTNDVVDRDEFSTTTQLPDGKLKTSLSSEPMNFKKGDSWQPVNTELREEGDGALSPRAVDGDVVIPSSLGSPVELEHEGHQVSFRLVGASGEAEAGGAEALFEDALTGVDARYAATARGVKETLVLANASAPSFFRYDVRAAASWSAAVADGSVVLRDADGKERYRVSAPLAWDSASDPAFTNDLQLSVSKVSDGRWTVTLRPDSAWLEAPDRKYPVSIDPDFSWTNGITNFHGAVDTYLASGDQANSVFSAASYLQTGHYNRVYKSLLKFDIAAAIPTSAIVAGATFNAYAPPATPKSIASHSLRTVTAEWDVNANWNRRKVGVPWNTSGGDVSSNAALTSAAVNVKNNPGWYSWTAPLATVQGWVDGSMPNYGFQLATNADAPSGNSYVWASTEASPNSTFPADSTKWPTLDVTWTSPPSGPTLTVTGSFIDNAGVSFAANAKPVAAFEATSANDEVAAVSVSVDGQLIDGTDATTCQAPCHTFAGNLDMSMTAVAPGTHVATFTATDSAGRVTTHTQTFSRSAAPSFEDLVEDWRTSYTASLEAAVGLPSNGFPTPTDAVLGDGSCQASPDSRPCLRSAAAWAADLQQWLEGAGEPSDIPDELPPFPGAAEDDNRDGGRAAADAIAGMVRLAENVARSPQAPQSVGIAFDSPKDGQQLQSWATARADTSEIGFVGAPTSGGWKFFVDDDESPSLAAAVNGYYAEAERQARANLAEVEEDQAADATYADDQDVSDAESALDAVLTQAPLIQGVGLTLTDSAARSALDSAATGSLGATVVAPNLSSEANTTAAVPLISTSEPSARTAQRAGPLTGTCDSHNEADVIGENQRNLINPAYFAPSRHAADSYVIAGGRKEHSIAAIWLAPQSLAWLCAGEAIHDRGIELEARVAEGWDRWSDGWNPDSGKRKNWSTNLPGPIMLDDISDGAFGFGDPYPFDKGEYPDFALVDWNGRKMQYGKRYAVRFQTNAGDTGSIDLLGLVTYSIQANYFASSIQENVYCGIKHHYSSCMFAASTACATQQVPFMPRKRTTTDWRALMGSKVQMTGASFVNYNNANPDGGYATSPCRIVEVNGSQHGTSDAVAEPPTAEQSPFLDGCEGQTAACSVNPGVWPAGTVLAYGAGLCAQGPAVCNTSAQPQIVWRTTSGDTCTEKQATATVVATSSATGKSRYVQLLGPKVRDCPDARATLTWDTTADIDLHIWDNEDNYAWWRSLGGIPHSRLLLDNTTGYGPEHFVELSDAGRAYTFGVCYYGGSEPTDVQLKLRHPNGSVQTFTVHLAEAGDFEIVGDSPFGAGPTVTSGWCDAGTPTDQ